MPDLLPETVQAAKEYKPSLFWSNKTMTFLSRITQQYPFTVLPSVGTVDHISMIYQFQLPKDNETASLAAYFGPLATPKIVFFWIGKADQINRDENALPWLRKRNMDWQSLSEPYAQWLELAKQA